MNNSNPSARTLFAKAAQLQLANQLPAAEQMYRQLLVLEPDHYEALNNLGLALLDQGRVAEAGKLVRHAASLRPEAIEARFNLGKVLIDEGAYDLAIACIDGILAQKPDDPQANLAMAFAVEQKGSFDDAEAYYHDAAQFSAALGLTRQIAYGREFYERISRPYRPAHKPEIRAQRREPGVEYVVAVSCDPRYFEKYCAALISSMKNINGNFLLHLHVIDPDEAFADSLPGLIDKSGLQSMVVSTEASPAILSAEKDRRTYFACARFLHLAHWLRHYGLPVVAIDADAVVEGQLREFVTAVDGMDVGLYFRHPRRAPWLDVCAGVVIANPTSNATSYFDQVAAYIDHYLQTGEAFWHLDQIALYCTLKMRGRFGGALRTKSIGGVADRVLWQIGQSYDHKLLEERYTRHLAPKPGT